MKSYIAFILSLFVFVCLCTNKAKANYAAGGELIYEWISGSTYRFYFKLYRNCGGGNEPTTLPLCFSSSCNTTTFSLTMSKFPQTVPPYKFPCPQLQTTCDNPSATHAGYQEVWYYADANLPFQCNSWRIFTYLSTRSASVNIANATSTNMIIDAYFNNTGAFEGNSSPYYSNKPFINACQNTPFAFNNGAVEPNADSIVNEVLQPLTGTGSCSGTATGVSYNSAAPPYPPYSIPGNPLQTGNTFSLNQQTGLMSFTPVQLGTSTIAIRTKEYRNGVLVGSVMREMPINVYSCGGAQPIPMVQPLGNPNGYHTCNGQPVNFCFDVKSPPGSKLWVSDNHNAVMPGSTVTYQNLGTDSVRGCGSWTPSATASGLYTLTVTVTDSNCNSLVVYSHVSTLQVRVWNKLTAGPDTTVCVGSSFDLISPGSNLLTWSVLSGDVNSLSCTNCPYPTVTPKTSLTYEVTVNGLPAGCPAKKDTVNINVIPYNKPYATITASPGTNIWPGLNVTFTATTVYCDTPQYQWRINGNSVPGATGAVFNTTSLINSDIVTCLLTCSDTCIIDTPSNAITMDVATGINDIEAHSSHLYPNPNNGTFTLTTGSASNVDLHVINQLGQLVWSQRNVKAGTSGNIEVQTGSLSAGHYMLKVVTDGRLEMMKFSIRQ